MIKRLLSTILVFAMMLTLSIPAFAAEGTQDNTPSVSNDYVEVITDPLAINQILNEKGIYEEGEEVLAIIQSYNTAPPPAHVQPRLIIREIYSEYDGYYSGTKATPKYTNDYPAGSFEFNQTITSGWQLGLNLGLKVEVFEAALGYTLNRSTTEAWTYKSPEYSYDFTVKAYINYEREYYKIYDADLMYDDYIGRTYVERETGYTLKVTRQ